MIAAAAPARVEEASKNTMRDEISGPPIQAKIDGDLSEWARKRLGNDPIQSVLFQLGLEGNKLVVAYKTDQSEMPSQFRHRISLCFYPRRRSRLMLRTSGSGDDKKPEVGDIRLFVTKRNGKVLAVTLSAESHGLVETGKRLPHRGRGDLR